MITFIAILMYGGAASEAYDITKSVWLGLTWPFEVGQAIIRWANKQERT